MKKHKKTKGKRPKATVSSHNACPKNKIPSTETIYSKSAKLQKNTKLKPNW